MNRFLLVLCLQVCFVNACTFANGQEVRQTLRVAVPEPVAKPELDPSVRELPPMHDGLGGHRVGSHENLVDGSPSHQHLHPQAHAMVLQAGSKPNPMSFSIHRAGDGVHCPLRLQHVPFGVWIEIEGTWYQHKSLNNTADVCVNFEITPSSFQPSVVIRTASSPSEIRQSETSMSRSVLLVPGQTVEFDYAREFGEQLRKKLSRSEQESIARMLQAESDSTPFNRMVSAPILANQELQPDQIASIQISKVAVNIELSARSTVWDVSPTNGPLLTLRGGTRLLSSLAPNVRLKAKVKSSYVNGAKETISKTFEVFMEGELGRGRVSESTVDKSEIDCSFDFNRLFNSNTEFASYIGSARNSGQVECSFSDVKLEFYNNRFDNAITSKFDGIAVEPFSLKLDLKFPK